MSGEEERIGEITEEKFAEMKQDLIDKIKDMKYGERVIVMIAHKSPYNIIKGDELGVGMQIDVTSMGCNIDELAMALVSLQMRPEITRATLRLLTTVKRIEDAKPDGLFKEGGV